MRWAKLLAVTLLVVTASGCYGLFDPYNPDPPVIPPAPADKRPAPILFGGIKNRLRIGTPLGEFAGGLICGPFSGPVSGERIGGAFEARNLTDVFYRTMTYAGYDVAGNPALLFDVQDDVARGELIIAGSLVDLRTKFCDRRMLYGLVDSGISGEVEIRFDWAVYSKLHRRVLYEKTTTGRAASGRGQYDGDLVLISHAIANALERLAADDGFRAVVFDTPDFVGSDIREPGSAPPPSIGDNWDRDPDVDRYLVIQGPARGWQSVRDDASGAVDAVVQVGGPGGFGSGFFIGTTPDGSSWLLTNNHVVGAAERVRLSISRDDALEGRVARRNPRRDVALVRVSGPPPAVLSIRREPLDLGEAVYAIGTPLSEKRRRTLNRGIVSAFRIDELSDLPAIQADVVLHGGMSGGPLVDEGGAVVGIAYETDIAEDGMARAAGISFFIPILDALERLDVSVVGPGR